jgi:hypothetical protein
MKEAICERFGLLLRINSDYLRTEGRFTLIGWLVEIWFMQEAFHASAARLRRAVPLLQRHGARRRPTSAIRVRAGHRCVLARAAIKGLVDQTYPETISSPFGRDTAFTDAYAVFTLRAGGHVIGRARLRDFMPFGIGPWELAADLAVRRPAAPLAVQPGHRLRASTAMERRAAVIRNELLRSHVAIGRPMLWRTPCCSCPPRVVSRSGRVWPDV